MNVTIQGEVHGSEEDKEAILTHGLESFDCLLIEGRKPEIEIQNLTIGYSIFIIGYVLGSWIQSTIETESGVDLQEEAENADIEYNDQIDADIPTMYQMVPERLKQVIGLILLLLIPVAIIGVNRLVLVLYISTIPLLYTGLVDNVGIRFAGGKRNQYMANEIVRIADRENYDEAIVLCGQSHLYGLTDELESRGHEVTSHDSNHWLRYPYLILKKVNDVITAKL
ncbi:hypothetical protein [Salinibaculum rarum]|uniref:hypothetical protein n=1 Tax=Salinibaculum rarum TaxID=3058903 RepID=UPI00265E6913|nr:hypothetical protein [Salinibaculum sp. KK48]